ncbi:MAG: hypothetical protein EBT68_02970 [Verrucomicrobia bacterium]|nr:hypothetical protein [Verrucomicrobiota bacterium]
MQNPLGQLPFQGGAVTRMINAGNSNFDSSNYGATTLLHPGPTMLGQSLGSIVSTDYIATEATSIASVLNVGGARIGTLLQNSPSFTPSVNAGLAQAGVLPGTQAYQDFFFIAQTVIDDGDSFNYGQFWNHDTIRGAAANSLHTTLLQEMIGDQTVPNMSTEDLARVMQVSQAYAKQPISGLVQEDAGPESSGLGVLYQFSGGAHGFMIDGLIPVLTGQCQTQVVTWLGLYFQGLQSTVTNIPSRPVTIYLPRGYTQNTWKKYPVLYFHDGQNVFFPGGSFGTWDADRIANHEISQGRMRESILVAIPNGNAYGSDRLYEYLPDGDTITNYAGLGLNFTGRASLYLRWILDNLTPTLDLNFRTCGISPADTLTAGSSMGGLISDYIGSQRPDRFGAVGIFSPAYWAGPNYANRSITNQPVRRYLYMGTAESSGGQGSSNVYWQDCLNAYNRYLGANEAVNRDLVFEGGVGGQHNESNWSRRLPSFYAFALNPKLEANPLAAELFPPELSVQSMNAATGQINLRLLAFHGYQNLLLASADLQTWSTNALSSAENFWDPIDVPVPGITGNRAFWRVNCAPTDTSTNTSNFNNLLSVTYNSQGGSAVPAATTSPGGSISAAPASPTRSGYTFTGWFTNPTGGSPIAFPYLHNQSSSFTLYARWASPSGPASITRNISYATNGGITLQLDAYRPAGAGPFPSIILVHGGGFVSGSRGNGYIADLAAALQGAGYAAFDISYRLLGANSTGMAAAQEDLKGAINYVVANAGTLEVDTNRLGTGGGSAGAITALLVSYGSNRATFRPRAVVDLWGAMYGDEGSIRAGDPPMIIIHGTTDTTVPYSYATAINSAATSVGVPVTFFSFNGGHTPALPTVIGGISIQQRVIDFLDQNLR